MHSKSHENDHSKKNLQREKFRNSTATLKCYSFISGGPEFGESKFDETTTLKDYHISIRKAILAYQLLNACSSLFMGTSRTKVINYWNITANLLLSKFVAILQYLIFVDHSS